MFIEQKSNSYKFPQFKPKITRNDSMKCICIEITSYGVVNYRDINQSDNSKAKDFYYL